MKTKTTLLGAMLGTLICTAAMASEQLGTSPATNVQSAASETFELDLEARMLDGITAAVRVLSVLPAGG
jgi:hypothetical protein